MRVVIIGGSDAGISAGLRARELDPAASVQVLLADSFPNYSICGLPFYVSGETPDWRDLAHRGREELARAGIELLTEVRAGSIDPSERLVRASGTGAGELNLGYDRLVIGTGAEPVRPPIPGLDREGVHLLHTMEDSFQMRRRVEELDGGRVLIVGGGYIGLEMADAFRHRGLEVTLVEQLPEVMPTVDAGFGARVAQELRLRGVEVVPATAIQAVEEGSPRLRVRGADGFRREVDLVLVSVGVRPSSQLAAAAGAETGPRGGIRVNRRMETNLPGVFAAGDCVETWHRILERPAYLPLGTTSHKQGRVAGENAVGGSAEFEGSLGTLVVKVFDLAIARTGLRDQEAREAGFDSLTTETTTWDHKAYYPGAHELRIRVTGDRRTGRLLGAQMVGHPRAEVAKRIDIFATALFHRMTVDAISDLDLSYTPPFSAPWDPVQTAAQDWVRAFGAANTTAEQHLQTGRVADL
ncbi:MAG: FAD-dependent oxidoreductase [Candidatus Dormibacteraeota bacterium]|nr:FAD-dependent oxidoreductase [Candidatus Dormibacteraeota bacterium]